MQRHQNHEELIVWALLSPDVLSIQPSFDTLFHPSIQHPSHRKPVPAAPPNGSAIICSQSFQPFFFPLYSCEPQMVLRLSRVLHGATYVQCFPQLTFPPTLMNQNCSEAEGQSIKIITKAEIWPCGVVLVVTKHSPSQLSNKNESKPWNG